jgi:response regulator RpfG family c-di-GMP phosphodiesterase
MNGVIDSGAIAPDHTAPSHHNSVLCVDDEANILAALKRLLRPEGYRVLTATSAKEGFELLEAEPSIGVVISDMRMPVMNGAEFLEGVRKRWPQAARLLLTGHSDMEATIGAINRGEIQRYISKPWDDYDIVAALRIAFEKRALEQERDRLQQLTIKQNIELAELNTSLELRVKERTAELAHANSALGEANQRLRGSLLTTLKVFSTLVELRESDFAGHSRRVAELSRSLARQMGLKGAELQDVFVAGLLHDVGKIGMSEATLREQSGKRGGELSGTFKRYPIRGEQLVTPLPELRQAGRLIRSHRERIDGRGFPDGLRSVAIPLGARIVSLAKDIDGLQIGLFGHQRLTLEAARAEVARQAVTNYGQDVVDAYLVLVGQAVPAQKLEIKVAGHEVQEGMVLSRDLTTSEGILLLSADKMLDPSMVECIRAFHVSDPIGLQIFIHPAAAASPGERAR